MEVKTLLDQAPVTKESDYLEVREIEIDGKKYRRVVQFAGRGRTRRELPAKYQVFENGKWKPIEEIIG